MNNSITEGVGKKIVEALKKQSDIEIQQVVENPAEPVIENNQFEELHETAQIEDETTNDEISYEEPVIQPHYNSSTMNTLNFTQPVIEKETFINNDLDGFEIPNNITILKQLIGQLPAGVSKQTGAQIIKQTMEALGISMRNVLQEAQQVQESLNNSSRECQASIIEYKKQINVLEKQSQKYQRQYAAINDIISLFVQNI